MAATLTTAPDSPAYHRDNNFIALTTDLIDLVPGTIHLDISSTGPTAAETLVIAWAGQSVTLTVAATTNSTATAWPTKDGGETLAEYADRIFDALRENDILTADFYVLRGGTVGSDERVTLQQIVPGELDITVTDGLTNVATTVTDGAAPLLEDNLSAYVQVFTAAADPNDDARVVSLHAPYRTDDAVAEFDLKDLLPLSPALPTASTIGQVVALEWPHGVATEAFTKYYLRYADKYGTPAVSEALLKSTYYYMLYGGKPGDITAAGSLGFARVQHAYTRADGGDFRKPVTVDQPDWLYLWTNSAITAVEFEVEVTWDDVDNTVTTESLPGTAFDLAAKTLYWISCGPAQYDLEEFTPPVADAKPLYFTFRVLGTTGLGASTISEVKYKLIPCTDFKMFLLLDNGLAGCESVLVKGKKRLKYEGERDIARRLRWTDFGVSTGDLLAYNQEGQQVWELNTGWHPKYYIEHLRQLLLGQLWIIDTDNTRFLRVIADSKSFDVQQDDQQLYSLSLTVRAGWLDTNQRLV